MKLQKLTINQSLNAAYRRVKPTRNEIEKFKSSYLTLLKNLSKGESEENHKNDISRFLEHAFYAPNFYMNTKGSIDLAIHNDSSSDSSVGVIIETKAPSNKSEMISETDLNKKAFQELVLYYLRERITGKNLEIRHLIVTNVEEWFIFDAREFERLFARNRMLVKKFKDFELGRLSSTKTELFYRDIAKPSIEEAEESFHFAYFKLRDFEDAASNADTEDDKKIIPFFKVLSPTHLLKLPFANDSNSLDRSFYNELLHLMGLEEIKKGQKKLIERKKASDRNQGSLIENAITIIESEGLLSEVPNLKDYGDEKDEQFFNIALELALTWVNRVLFIKLLEGHLLKFHEEDKDYQFLNFNRIQDYDGVNKLFFQVLAVKDDERSEIVSQQFGKVPYLNSSLFEPTPLEKHTIRINSLENEQPIPIFPSTVLKDRSGKRLKGELLPLKYRNFSKSGGRFC
ncbi:MAG: hypothetical protein GY854_24745 [Deltaproteobacteria bacterium]|nr:hypothetical protein [Deltaproteobacteria bacterium]